MTVWAGYYVRDPRGRASPALIDALRRLVSRRPGATPSVIQFDRAAIVYVESDALGSSSAHVVQGDGATLVAGEPLISTNASGERSADIALLHSAWLRGSFAETARATGCFAGVNYDERNRRLSLVPDKLGLRPIYYAVTGDVVYFAGALRVLEGLDALPKVVDVLGALETVSLGYPLGDRTPYRDVHAVRDAEVVVLDNREIRRSRYWNIAQVPEEPISLADAAARVHSLFSRAIDRRLRKDRTSVAFLSGGLDSRCMVAELVERGVSLHTFNFANEGTKDQILGDAYASVVGTIHSRTPRPADPVRWSMTMADVWARSPNRSTTPPERPGLIWSGDGGSVGLGFVGVYASVIELLRAGKRDDAVAKYFVEHEISVPIRVFRRELSRTMHDMLHQSVREAFDEVRSADAGRELYFFRMVHDQRRHLVLHWEDLDLHQLEFHLPFYDWELIEAVAATPVDYGVGHRLYNEALRFFPPSINKVAWQTYPGHEPCPIPLPAGAIDQWGARQKDIVRRKRRQQVVAETARVMFSRSFPRSVLDRRYLLAATVAHWLGVGDYAYAVDYAKAFTDMWTVASGRWELPAPRPKSA
jgi:asparagine synthase (glutamine-hydrolysing)